MTTKPFSGFPQKVSFTPIPNLFFSALLPQIDDIAELKLSLHIFWTLYQRRGYPRFITYRELITDRTLVRGVGGLGKPEEVLRHALKQAVERGILLHVSHEDDDLYFLNNEEGRRTKEKVESGEIPLGRVIREPELGVEEQPNIFSLYEENIGLITPIIAEELREAEKLYPASWIEAAFREAVSLNKRSLRYILRILERWAAEGKDSGELGRDHKKEETKYIKGRYGHLVKR